MEDVYENARKTPRRAAANAVNTDRPAVGYDARPNADAHEAGSFMPFCVCDDVANLAKRAFIGACDEDVGRPLDEPFDDADDLCASLAAAKNNLRKALSRRARVVNARETDVFKVKILDALDGIACFESATLVGR